MGAAGCQPAGLPRSKAAAEEWAIGNRPSFLRRGDFPVPPGEWGQENPHSYGKLGSIFLMPGLRLDLGFLFCSMSNRSKYFRAVAGSFNRWWSLPSK